VVTIHYLCRLRRLEISYIVQKVEPTQKINILELRNNILIFDYWTNLQNWTKAWNGSEIRWTHVLRKYTCIYWGVTVRNIFKIYFFISLENHHESFMLHVLVLRDSKIRHCFSASRISDPFHAFVQFCKLSFEIIYMTRDLLTYFKFV
jgi:hypothetical protein